MIPLLQDRKALFIWNSAQFQLALTIFAGSLFPAITGCANTMPMSPSFNLSLSARSLDVPSGARASSTIKVIGQNGFSDNVNLAIAKVPSGVTAVFSPPITSSTSSLAFEASSTAAPGNYTVAVIGTSGNLSNSTAVHLAVQPQSSSAQMKFSVSSSSPNLTIVAGASATSTISVNDQNGFSGNVKLTATGMPAGVTAAFSRASTTSTSSLEFMANSSAVPGQYTVTVTGHSGSQSSSTTMTLTVMAPASMAPASFSLSLSSSSLTLVAGASASSTISVNDQNGFVADVNLTASGLPSGISATFSPVSTASTSSVKFFANSSVPAGSYPVTITGTSGSLEKSTAVMLDVTEPTVPATFSLSSSSPSVALLPGASATSTISVNDQNGFNGNVNLTASGLPSGISAVFSPASTASTSSLALTATSAAAPGNYTVSVTGTSGSLIQTTTVSLTITQPGVSIAISQPKYRYNVLPGSVRRIYATVTGGTTNAVNWAVDGGATLSSSSGHWVDVTAPPAGSSCSISGTSSSDYAVSSATRFSITAQSVENPAAASTITVNVCNPAVQVNVVPFYTTLYAGQKADVQSFVWGASNPNVTWSLTSQPSGGDGAITDASNLDTVFSATVAGRYTLTATSIADSTKTNTATVYVTGNPMPSYGTTPSETEPVDCTVDPAMTGKVYEVGPSQAYKTITSVPWPSLAPGSTVRIHNEDTTGSAPTTYHEYFQVVGHASRTQPIRVCGVPDAQGNLPVIDANDSTGVPDANVYADENYGAVVMGGSYSSNWTGLYTGTWTGSQDLIFEGLEIKNADAPNTRTSPQGVVGTAWGGFSACIRLFASMDTVVRGVNAHDCGLGFFSDFNDGNGYAMVANTLYEGNHLHANGVNGSNGEHQLYIQGWDQVVQFNLIDQYPTGAQGSNLKSRGYPDVIRYNHFGDGAARQLDLDDNQDGVAYMTFEGYLSGGANSFKSIYPADAYTADLLAAAVEAHHADYVYGNTFTNSTAMFGIHYFSDQCDVDANRLGTLWFNSNSFHELGIGTNYAWYLFDTSAGGAYGNCPAVEWPQIQVLNNAFWLDNPAKPYFFWILQPNEFTTFGRNAIDANWGTNNMNPTSQAAAYGTGWPGPGYLNVSPISPYAFQGATTSADTAGVQNLIGVSTAPFNLTTFVPNAALINKGTGLPATWPKLPVRFQFGPSAIPIGRTQPLTLGAMERNPHTDPRTGVTSANHFLPEHKNQ